MAADDLDGADIVDVEILQCFFGMTADVASATNAESVTSKPYCFDVIAGMRPMISNSCTKGDGSRLDFDRSAELTKNVNKIREGLTFKFCECFGGCELTSLDDFNARVEARHEKVLQFLEQFS